MGIRFRWLSMTAVLTLAACGGGSNSGSSVGTSPPPPQNTSDSGCSGFCANANSFLTEADVQTIIAQAVNEALAQNKPAVISVVDRVGNVLGVYRMTGAPATIQIKDPRPVSGGLEGLNVPPELGAISKADTAVYFSSEGNAFTSRTAGQVAQEHFNPGDATAPAGPLFGVQISNLRCSDINQRFTGGTGPGTHSAPLALSPDPGGISLYKAGVPVGAIGVAGAKPIYTLDDNAEIRDVDMDEMIAVAGSFGFVAPADRRADQITAGGLVLQYTNESFSDLATNPATAPPYSALAAGSLVAVPAYADAVILRGTAFGQPESGIRADTTEWPGLDAFVVVDKNNQNRFPPRDGTDGASALTANEVRTIIAESIKVSHRTRAQVRRPLGSPAGETIVISDTNGVVLGIGRTRDALVDAIDVTTQKARTAAFFSGAYAAADIQSVPPANYFADTVAGGAVNITTLAQSSPAKYVTALRAFLNQPTALADGAIAYSDRAIGLLAQPLYPSGVPGAPNGPLSLPFDRWSPFQTGLELDLSYNQLLLSIAYILNQDGLAINIDGATAAPAPSAGTPTPLPDVLPGSCTGISRLPNGISLFPGSVPIYRNGVLVGGIGASGDGSDQSDLVAFVGLSNGAAALNTGLQQAPPNIRADNLAPLNARLLYVQCPQAPFIDTNDANVCGGL
ncbi:MAG: heme-binding protein [Rudaea sp.]